MSRKRDFTLYQRVRIFLYRYDTRWLEYAVIIAVFLLFMVSGPIAKLFPDEQVPPPFNWLYFAFLSFTMSLIGWIRVIKGEMKWGRWGVHRGRFATYTGILWIIVTWSFMFLLLISAIFGEENSFNLWLEKVLNIF